MGAKVWEFNKIQFKNGIRPEQILTIDLWNCKPVFHVYENVLWWSTGWAKKTPPPTRSDFSWGGGVFFAHPVQSSVE